METDFVQNRQPFDSSRVSGASLRVAHQAGSLRPATNFAPPNPSLQRTRGVAPRGGLGRHLERNTHVGAFDAARPAPLNSTVGRPKRAGASCRQANWN